MNDQSRPDRFVTGRAILDFSVIILATFLALLFGGLVVATIGWALESTSIYISGLVLTQIALYVAVPGIALTVRKTRKLGAWHLADAVLAFRFLEIAAPLSLAVGVTLLSIIPISGEAWDPMSPVRGILVGLLLAGIVGGLLFWVGADTWRREGIQRSFPVSLDALMHHLGQAVETGQFSVVRHSRLLLTKKTLRISVSFLVGRATFQRDGTKGTAVLLPGEDWRAAADFVDTWMEQIKHRA